MEKGEFDYIFLTVGIVVGVLIVVVSMYRLCCYKNRVPTGEITTTQALHVTQVDIVRVPPTGASSP